MNREQRAALEPLEPASRRALGPVARPIYSTGVPELDARVSELVDLIDPEDRDLVREILTTAVRLSRQRATRGELKMVNSALKEFAYSFRVFAPYRGRRKVSIFGSARIERGQPEYECTREFARQISERGWMVITGAGPGVMQAGHEGAGAQRSFGVNIRLPMPNPANMFIAGDAKLINFKYFFTRKVTFMKESDAFVLLPGGFGTLDETFELLTLMQTGKSDLHPVVLLQPAGSTYWDDWLGFIRGQLLTRGLINEDDLHLFTVASTPEYAIEVIEGFYRNYHSARFIGERLVVRLRQLPDEKTLARWSEEFADLLASGTFEIVPASPEEVEEEDALEFGRVAFYPVHNYGRMRQFIDAVNAIV